jgi:hypothetical protein
VLCYNITFFQDTQQAPRCHLDPTLDLPREHKGPQGAATWVAWVDLRGLKGRVWGLMWEPIVHHSGSTQVPLRFHSGSTQVPLRFHSGALRHALLAFLIVPVRKAKPQYCVWFDLFDKG